MGDDLDVPRLRISTDGRSVVATPGRALTIGRGRDCDVQLRDSRVSRHHATIHWDDANWRLDDTDSPNGTFCDGERVTSLPLTDR